MEWEYLFEEKILNKIGGKWKVSEETLRKFINGES